mmetsp:Transcript_67096/g.187723  ORF Transcript_67096/g.187723 Transcript_67096/m.187723 type:complete len:222 (-) Transcript_67096:48-713(-)
MAKLALPHTGNLLRHVLGAARPDQKLNGDKRGILRVACVLAPAPRDAEEEGDQLIEVYLAGVVDINLLEDRIGAFGVPTTAFIQSGHEPCELLLVKCSVLVHIVLSEVLQDKLVVALAFVADGPSFWGCLEDKVDELVDVDGPVPISVELLVQPFRLRLCPLATRGGVEVGHQGMQLAVIEQSVEVAVVSPEGRQHLLIAAQVFQVDLLHLVALATPARAI